MNDKFPTSSRPSLLRELRVKSATSEISREAREGAKMREGGSALLKWQAATSTARPTARFEG